MEKNYNAEILKLEITEIDTTFSKEGNSHICGRSNYFYIVPTEMVISGSRDLWKGCPPLVNFDMLKCINEIIESGQYQYNSTVGELFCNKFGLPKYEEHSFLSAIVYCTQSYKSSIDDETKAREFHEQITAKGYVKATDNFLKSIVNTPKRFYVVRNGSTFLGDETKVENLDKLLLKDWGNMGLHWMHPRAKRKGYRATIGQYIKEAI